MTLAYVCARTAVLGALAWLAEFACKPEPVPDYGGAVEFMGLEP